MKIKEITTVHQSDINLKLINRDNEIPKNDINGYNCFKNIQDGFLIYYLVDDNEIIAAVILKDTGKYLQIKRVFVKNQYRGKLLAFKLYHKILYSEYKNLMSDTQQTYAGKKIWQELSRIVPIKSYNLNTGEISDMNAAYNENDDIVVITDASKLYESILIPNLIIKELTDDKK